MNKLIRYPLTISLSITLTASYAFLPCCCCMQHTKERYGLTNNWFYGSISSAPLGRLTNRYYTRIIELSAKWCIKSLEACRLLFDGSYNELNKIRSLFAVIFSVWTSSDEKSNRRKEKGINRNGTHTHTHTFDLKSRFFCYISSMW